MSTGAVAGTIDIAITGSPLRQFQGLNIVASAYAEYSFDFIATAATSSLTITNNTTASVEIDIVSVHLL